MEIEKLKICPRHGSVKHYLTKDGVWRCTLCRTERVENHRRKRKKLLVDMKGGKCERCGYDKCIDALEFHHLNPQEKDFGLSDGRTRSFSRVKEELNKCILVCSNCHKEIHSEIRQTNMKNLLKEVEENMLRFEAENGAIEFHKRCHGNINLDIDMVQQLANEGLSKTDIAKHLNVSRGTITRFIKNNKILWTQKPAKLNDYTVEQFNKDWLELKNYTQIGRKYNVSGNAIKKWMRSRDIKI